MTARRAGWVFTASMALALALTSAPETARADGDAATRAEELAARAFERAQAAAYGEAIDLYLRSYDEAPSSRVLFNVAWIYDAHLHDGARAMAYYRRYVAEPDVEPDLVRRAEARLEVLASLEPPRPPAVAEPAQHAPVPLPAPAPAAAGGSPLRTWAFVAGGAGLGAIAVGTVLGVVAKSKNDEAASTCTGHACTDPNAVHLTDQALSAARGADVAFVAGGALLAGGVVMLLLAPRSRVQVAASAGPRSVGVGVSGALP